jgi:heme exporter protein A
MFKGLVLEARSLACERGGRLIFKDLDFAINGGEAVELRGPNGAGKSSLLRLLAGLNRPAAGTISLTSVIPAPSILTPAPSIVIPAKAGIPLAIDSVPANGRGRGDGEKGRDAEVALLAHYIGHHEAVKPALSVRENLEFWSRFLGGEGVANLTPFRLENLAHDEARYLSEGQRRRLALSRLVSVQRPIWLLDEPTVGLDQAALADLRREMEAHLASGGIIIAATHADLGLKSVRTLEIKRAA